MRTDVTDLGRLPRRLRLGSMLLCTSAPADEDGSVSTLDMVLDPDMLGIGPDACAREAISMVTGLPVGSVFWREDPCGLELSDEDESCLGYGCEFERGCCEG